MEEFPDLSNALVQTVPEIETDLPQAISDLSARQAAYQASLSLAGNLFKLSLFDYL